MGGRIGVAAVDLGASSGRVVHAEFADGRARLREVHRFPNTPVTVGGTLHWDVLGLYRGILDGLRLAHDLHRTIAAEGGAGGIDSIGIDSWAVDYGLLDADGRLLANPVHYRDSRNPPAAAATVDRIGAAALYDATGTQFLPFNTIFQLVAEGPRLLGQATHAALIPDLLGHWLTGELGTELTNASTTGLLDTRTLDWHRDLAARAGVDTGLFPPLRRPGTVLGPLRPDVGAAEGLGRPLVATVPSHDTAAAVAGVPATTERFAFVATGTWALVGVTVPQPVITEASRAANFTNEVAADGAIRLLRNVTGFWLLQECQRAWRAAGQPADAGELVAAAREVGPLTAVLDVSDPSLLAPGDMPRRVRALARGPGATALASPAAITRCILDSMAIAVRTALRDAAAVSGSDPDVVHLVGGGVHNALFCQLVADACGRPVLAGPSEAAAWGNALYQAVALGVLEPAATRGVVREAETITRYDPSGDDSAWARAADSLEAAVR